MTGLEGLFLAVLAVIGVVASRLDITERRLPHWLCAVALAAGLAVSLVLGGFALMGSALLHAMLALLGGMLLFALGMIGGGDAKYYAALAAWFALRDGLFLLVSVTLCGLLLLLPWFLVQRRKVPVPPAGEADARFRQLPYGVAISLGALLSFALLALRG